MKRLITAALFAALVLALSGCQPLEKSVRDAIAAQKSFLDKAVQNHEAECKVNPAKLLCQVINEAGYARNLAIDALEIYCAGSDFERGGNCNPPRDKAQRDKLAAKLKAAALNMNRIFADLKLALEAYDR